VSLTVVFGRIDPHPLELIGTAGGIGPGVVEIDLGALGIRLGAGELGLGAAEFRPRCR